jgi:2-polyprenyl-3-methyl-5-hydroxy-6-metoxy-1,4-benzoquinol methylase
MTNYSGRDNLEAMKYATNYNAFLFHLIKKGISRKDRVLDFGAGIGTFAKLISKFASDTICIEPDKDQLNHIKYELGLKAKSNLDLVKNESVDVIYSLNVFEHIQDDFSAIKQCYKKIKPGGSLLVYVPAYQLLFSNMDKHVGHFRRYSMSDLSQKINASGFTIEKAEYIDSLGFLISFLYKFINKDGKISIKSIKIYDTFIFRISRLLDLLFGKYFGKNLFIIAKKH